MTFFDKNVTFFAQENGWQFHILIFSGPFFDIGFQLSSASPMIFFDHDPARS